MTPGAASGAMTFGATSGAVTPGAMTSGAASGDGALPSPPAVAVNGVTLRYGKVAALRQVSLEVDAGTIVAVLGPSGCGKSSLLRVVAGFERPEAGTVHLGGRLVTGPGVQVPPEARGVGIVPQDGALFPHLDVAGNVGFGLTGTPSRRTPPGSSRRWTADARADRVRDVLELVGLAGLDRRRPHELSGGQQQRVALARALAPRPGVVVLDEPFSALDAGLRRSLRNEVRQMLRREGATAVLVTHDQDEALSMADVVAVMEAGRIVESGAPTGIYRHPESLSTARFVGELVELPGTIRGPGADTDLGWVPGPPPPGTSADDPVTVTLRPEQIRLEPVEGPPGRVLAHPVVGVVRDVEFYGHDALVQVEVPSREPASPGPGGATRLVAVRTTHPLPRGTVVALDCHGPARLFAGSVAQSSNIATTGISTVSTPTTEASSGLLGRT